MGWSRFKEKYVNPAKDMALGYNPITMTTDAFTGGKASEMLGLEDSAYNLIAGKSEGPIGSATSDTFDDLSGKTAEDAAERASATEASAMLEQLDYLKEINKLPQQYKEQALTQMNEMFGGGPGSMEAQQGMVDRAKASPFYQEMLGGLDAGTESVARRLAGSGSGRSGQVIKGMADYQGNQRNQALTQSYNQQMQGMSRLAGLPTMERDIGGVMGDIGRTKAQGIMGQAQAGIQGTQNMFNTGMGIASLFI
jgi:hypothetical protein